MYRWKEIGDLLKDMSIKEVEDLKQGEIIAISDDGIMLVMQTRCRPNYSRKNDDETNTFNIL